MPRKLNNAEWTEHIKKFSECKEEITVKDYCIQNNLSKCQFYYHKKRLNEEKETSATVFYPISLDSNNSNNKENAVPSSEKEISINIGNAFIKIPVSETTLISSIIKELVNRC